MALGCWPGAPIYKLRAVHPPSLTPCLHNPRTEVLVEKTEGKVEGQVLTLVGELCVTEIISRVKILIADILY